MPKVDGRLAMKRQGGAALIVVLGIVAISTMIGLASMQSSQIDEKMAGNYKLATRTALFAERTATALIPEIRTGTSAVALPNIDINRDMNQDDFQSFAAKTENEGSKSCLIEAADDMTAAACYIEVPKGEEFQDRKAGNYIVAWSAISRGSKPFVGQPLIIQVNGSMGGHDDVLSGCEGVTVNSGGKILNGDIRTLQPGAGVRLSGGVSVGGDVTALGPVYTDSSIAGNVLADGDVTLNAGDSYVYGGSIVATGSVVFDNTAPVQGDVSANGDVVFNNGATVTGNVSSGGKVVFNSDAFVYGNVESKSGIVNNSGAGNEKYVGGAVETGSSQTVSAASSGECDPQSFAGGNNLATEMAHLLATVPTDTAGANKDITVGSYPTVNASLTPEGLSAFDETWNVQKDVTLAEASTAVVPTFDKPVSVIRTKDFTQSNGELNVSGGDVVLLVDGDLTLGAGGGKGLTIAPDSTLTIFVTGETHIKSSTQMADVPATTNGRLTLSIYSTHADSSSSSNGVLIDGSAQALAGVYAPYANVSVTAGGGLRGSVRGKTVTVDGGASIEHVKGLAVGGATSGGGISFTWL